MQVPAQWPVAPTGQFDTVLLWFRRDLRIADNPALVAALQRSLNVVGSIDFY